MIIGKIAARRQYLEATVFPALVLLISFYFKPADPLWVHGHFPWIWLVPALIGLRYGDLPAILTTLIIIVAMLYTLHVLPILWADYQLWLLGGVTLTLICTAYYRYWQNYLYVQIKKNDYMSSRLQEISESNGILRLSYERLEESFIIKPATLRDALLKIRELLTESNGELQSTIAVKFMELLAYYGSLDVAALYLYHDKQFDKNPLAFVGPEHPLVVEDPLVQNCMSEKKTTYLAVNNLYDEATTYLAVIPMMSHDEKIIALLTITDMPFLTLNEEVLKTLTLLLMNFADEAWALKQASELRIQYPDCPELFIAELFKLQHIWQSLKLDSTVFIFYVKPGPQQEDILFELTQQSRGLDLLWQIDRPSVTILIVLMPLTTRSKLTGYLKRIKIIFHEQHRVKVEEQTVTTQHRQISAYPDINVLVNELLAHVDV